MKSGPGAEPRAKRMQTKWRLCSNHGARDAQGLESLGLCPQDDFVRGTHNAQSLAIVCLNRHRFQTYPSDGTYST